MMRVIIHNSPETEPSVRKHHLLPALLLALAGMATGPAWGSIDLYREGASRLSLYGRLKPIVQYQKDRTPPYQDLELRDNASRIGLRGKHQLDEVRLYGKFELGTNIDRYQAPLLYTRYLYLGARNKFGRIQFGKQNALFKLLGNHDRSHALGGAALIADDELGTGRNGTSLMLATRFKRGDFRGQYSFAASLQERPSLRAGSERFSIEEYELESGVALYSRFRLLPSLRVRFAYQASEFQQQGEFNAVGGELELRGRKKVVYPWRAALMAAHYQLSGEQQKAKVTSLGLGGRVSLARDYRLYSSIEYLKGRAGLDGGKELTYVLGGQYQYHADLWLYTEGRQRTFDAERRDETRLVLGANYRF